MSYTKFEQETIINYNNEEHHAEIYTYDRRLIKRLIELVMLYPDNCYKIKDYHKDAFTCSIPKAWIKINPPRKLSDEQRKAKAERMKSIINNRETKKQA